MGTPALIIWNIDSHRAPPFILDEILSEYVGLGLLPWLCTQTTLAQLVIQQSRITFVSQIVELLQLKWNFSLQP